MIVRIIQLTLLQALPFSFHAPVRKTPEVKVPHHASESNPNSRDLRSGVSSAAEISFWRFVLDEAPGSPFWVNTPIPSRRWTPFAREVLRILRSGTRLKSLVQALQGHAVQYKEARECVRYIWNNRRRMRYPKFHKQAGVVEAGCKVVIGTRLKRAGMHWTVKGANRIIALCCSKLSGRFEDFWERRSDQRKSAA